jgi:cysteine desulfurase
MNSQENVSNRRIYLDNAATTPLDPLVFDAMEPYLRYHYGNPSSIHTLGRKAKSALETARKDIAHALGALPQEIIFTSGGTEADNMVLMAAVRDLGIQHIITSPIEHHAVLHTCEYLQKVQQVHIHYVQLDDKGNISIDHLEELLKQLPPCLVSLMHANNEIGNMIDLTLIGELVERYHGYFHSDTVQTVGHFPLNFKEFKVDFAVGAAHKFNGPKGVGFIYIRKKNLVKPIIHGGSQERGMRAGTENLASIVGMAEALKLSLEGMENKWQKNTFLKEKLVSGLQSVIADVEVNGDMSNANPAVLNLAFPPVLSQDLFLFQLDIHGICASGGSACSSGASKGSHVLPFISTAQNKNNIRFSFGKGNTLEDIENCIEKMKAIFTTSASR